MRQLKQKLPPVHSSNNAWSPLIFSDPLCGYVEALLFASDRPLSFDEMREILHHAELPYLPQQIENAVRELVAIYDHPGRGMTLIEVAGGWQFRSNPEHTELIRKLFQFRPPRLSQAALECMAVIAYRQPVTRTEIDAIRGVDSGGVLRSLLERRLVIVVGRHTAPGRPFLYGTSPEFLEFFGLNDLRELPSLADTLPSPPSPKPNDSLPSPTMEENL